MQNKIAALEAEIAQLETGSSPAKATLIDTRQSELNRLKEDLAWFAEEEANAQVRAAKIQTSLQSLSDSPVPIEVNAENIDAALSDVRRKASDTAMEVALAELSALSTQLKIATPSVDHSPRPAARPEPTQRPTPRPADYVAPQPNVTVESTFESNPNISVSVTVPVTITRQQRVDNKAIARAAGQEAERATRRGLDDAAIAEE